MARRNHYIPQLLLRRFASKRDGDKFWIWQVPLQGPPIEISTRDTAVAKGFYGAEETGVEAAFAKMESTFSTALNEIEAGGSTRSHEDILRQMVWTLAFRTRAFRDQFSGKVGRLMSAVLDSEELFRGFQTIAERQLSEIKPVELQADMRAAFAKAGLFEKSMAVLRSGIGEMEDAAERGQIEGLAALLGTNQVPSAFAPLDWKIYSVDSGSLILGDFCVLCWKDDGRLGPLVVKDWQTLYIPISPTKVLAASRQGSIPHRTAEELNVASAALSSNYFYCSEATDPLQALAASIGSMASLLVEDGVTP